MAGSCSSCTHRRFGSALPKAATSQPGAGEGAVLLPLQRRGPETISGDGGPLLALYGGRDPRVVVLPRLDLSSCQLWHTSGSYQAPTGLTGGALESPGGQWTADGAPRSSSSFSPSIWTRKRWHKQC